MRISSGVIPVTTLAVLLALSFASSVYAGAEVIVTEGVVFVDDATGTVGVDTKDYGTLFPVNGPALVRSGQIGDGDPVDVKIVYDNGRKHEHRGHVTVLK